MTAVSTVRCAVTATMIVAISACGGSSSSTAPTTQPPPSTQTPPSASPSMTELPVGKAPLTVGPGVVISPEGFGPAVSMRGAAECMSTHPPRAAFDLGQPDPDRDAPAVAVVVLRPPAQTSAEAAAGVTSAGRRAGAVVRRSSDRLAGTTTDVIDVVGGSGQIVPSVDHGIALDALPHARLRVVIATAGGHWLGVA